MKLNIFKTMIPAAALLLSASVTSCMSDLDDGNISPTVAKTVDLDGLYAKCYASLILEGNDGGADFTIEDAGKSTLLRNIFYFNELGTDESICWWSDGGIVDISYNRCDAGTATLRFLYYRLATNISFCNHYLEFEKAKEDATKYAEIRFIRAYLYYQMLDLFGDPMFVTTISKESAKQAHTYNDNFVEGQSYTRAELLQMGREFMFSWIESELLAAEADLLDAQPETDTDANYGRVDKAAAWMLLSRLYLNAGTYLNNDGQNNPCWDKALQYAQQVINSGYSLFTENKMSSLAKANGYTPYDLLFMGDNGSNGASCEAILPLLQDGKTTKAWGGTMFFVASFWEPSMENVIGLAGGGTTANTWSGIRVRRQFLEHFTNNPTTFEGKTTAQIRQSTPDNRAIFWGVGHTVDLENNTAFSQGIATAKWNNFYSNGDASHDTYDLDTDYFLFRVAEAYLNAAEAAYHLNGAAAAKQYLDPIRERANATPMNSYTAEDILAERGRELYCEGLRRPDLIRFNQYGGSQATYIWDYKGGYPNGGSFEKYRNLYPIPTSEIQANTNLIQIDGYN